MRYTKEEVEFIRVKLETVDNSAEIARQFIKKFNCIRELDAVRDKVNRVERTVKLQKSGRHIKRLFFDIETSQIVVKLWRTGKVRWVDAGRILKDKRIICISYKWQFEDEVKHLIWDDKHEDKKLVKKSKFIFL